MTPSDSTSCAQFERQLADYLAGALPTAAAETLETHAAYCARCETRLNAVTRRDMVFAPTVPPALRQSTMRAIETRAAIDPVQPLTARRTHWRLRAGLTTLAMAALVMVFVLRRAAPGADSAGRASDSKPGDAVVAPESLLVAAISTGYHTGMMQTAAQFAESQAKAEFMELDMATRELEAALVASPLDRELRRFLSSVRARRDELSRRVKDATS